MTSLINVLAVKWYGETEFWAAIGKVMLILALIMFTFITMLGGNPLNDRFGFRCVMMSPRSVVGTRSKPFPHTDTGKSQELLPSSTLRDRWDDSSASWPA